MSEELDWSEASDYFDEQRKARKTVIFNVDSKELKFVIKQLSQTESDKMEQKAIKIKDIGRGDPVTEVDTAIVKNMAIQFGVAKGPDGFNPSNKDHIAKLPQDIRNELADSIQSFSEIDEEVRIGFRPTS